MKNDADNPENLDFYKEITIAYENVLAEIEYLVEGSLIFSDSKDDPRKIKIDKYLKILNTKMDVIIKESTNRYYLEKEVRERFKEMRHEYVCDACGSMIDRRVGIMKWNDDKDPSTPEEWELMEKINEVLNIHVRWVTICSNPNCRKIWKEGEFEEEIVLPETQLLKAKIRDEVLRERGKS